MPDFAAAAAAIRTEFETEFGALSPTYDIAWENVRYRPVQGIPWVRLSIREGEAQIVSLDGGDGRRFRHPGVVIVQVFVPANDGDGLAREIADSVAAIFRGKTIDCVRFRAPYVQVVGPEGAWFQLNVYCNFFYDLIA